MEYSIIICTYNRSGYLKDTLASILDKFRHKANYELLVINNNSTDDTEIVVAPFLSVPHVHYFLEREQGLSHARNRGIKEATKDVLVFLDDDIDIEKNYLNHMDELFTSPAVSIIGGKVLPYGEKVPHWLPLQYYYLVSLFDLGDKVLDVRKLMGANYAMRKEVAEKVGWYNTELGRKGNTLTGGEEVDYLNRAKKLGYKVLYSPDLIVYHKIANKLNTEYIHSYSLNIGKSEFLIDYQNSKAKMIAKVGKAIAMISLYYLYGAYQSDPKRQTYFKINELYSFGYLHALKGKIFNKPNNW